MHPKTMHPPTRGPVARRAVIAMASTRPSAATGARRSHPSTLAFATPRPHVRVPRSSSGCCNALTGSSHARSPLVLIPMAVATAARNIAPPLSASATPRAAASGSCRDYGRNAPSWRASLARETPRVARRSSDGQRPHALLARPRSKRCSGRRHGSGKRTGGPRAMLGTRHSAVVRGKRHDRRHQMA